MMWLTKNMRNKGKASEEISLGSVTKVSQGLVEVDTAQPQGNMCFAAPYGVEYVPPVGEEVAVIPLKNGRVCLGVVGSGGAPLLTGEVRIFSCGGNSITLKNDGKILIEGDVYINGEEVSVRGGRED